MPAKLLVVAGPNKGATYFLEDGEVTVGRSEEATIVLPSSQVSKKHLILRVSNGGKKVEVEDAGSSNGSFLNGVLVKKKLLQNRDKVSLGPFVLEVLLPLTPAPRPAGATGTNIPGWNPNMATGNMAGSAGASAINTSFSGEEEPKNLIGKLKKRFDDNVLPVVYDFYEKYDFPTLFGVIFVGYTALSLGFTVYPVLERSREEILRQAEHQAQYITRQIADLNRQYILENKEASLFVDFAQSEVHVKEAVIVNLEGRILAPGNRLNEQYNNPYLLRYKDLLRKNQDAWKPVKRRFEEEIIAAHPIMVISKEKGISVPGAIAVVVYSTAAIALDSGTKATIYFEALVWALLLGVVFMYILYNLFFQPIRRLHDDMDKALKGDGDSVEKKYKSEEVNSLIDTVNSALSRIPKAGAAAGEAATNATDQEQLIADNMMRFVEMLAAKAGGALLLFDGEQRIKFANGSFEELTGIRGSVGEVIDNVSRDESFPSLVKEMMEKSKSSPDGVREDYDFPQGLHQIHATALMGLPGKVEGYLFQFEKVEG